MVQRLHGRTARSPGLIKVRDIMIRITQLKLRPDEGLDQLEIQIRKTLRLHNKESISFEVLRRSVDARKKPDLYYSYTVLVRFQDPHLEKKVLRGRLRNVEPYEPVRYKYGTSGGDSPSGGFLFSERDPERAANAPGMSDPKRPGIVDSDPMRPGIGDPDSMRPGTTDPDRPVIIGTGPAGLFCGLLLAREGRRPILIERGQRAKDRTKTVRAFWDGGSLDPDSNVQFGEGGAGTFSDGKLNTGVKDPEGRIRFVLETFVNAGADPDILYSGKPHVGTDVLTKVVTSITDEICGRGGDVFFDTRMQQISYSDDGTWDVSCCSKDKTEEAEIHFHAKHLVLAIGHSSRDTFSMLKDTGIVMRAKPFAVGVRVMHPQSMIDRAMYGDSCRFHMPPSAYKLTHRLGEGRGVYSFCMCPGGYVVNASSENGFLAVNGMSYHDRSSGTANSAIVVTVTPEEITRYMAGQNALSDKKIQNDVLIGVHFQRRLEQAAFQAGDGAIPVQCFSDFGEDKPEESTSLWNYEPCIMGRWKSSVIRKIFPAFLSQGIEDGIRAWDRQIKGFASPDSLLCAAESRTSSPVRIERGEDLQALLHPGLYPCGEGAGYAGGITSAAVDGLKVAEQILQLER